MDLPACLVFAILFVGVAKSAEKNQFSFTKLDFGMF